MPDPFRIRDHIPDYDALLAAFAAASDRARGRLRHEPDVRYGPTADERLDLFLPPGDVVNAPVHLFIHGGYWRAQRKEEYAFVAEPVVAAGAIAAIVGYSLMPAARMATLVDQVRRAARWLGANAAAVGGDPSRLSASGHSAGAHLASFLAAEGPQEGGMQTSIRSLLLISGLYDLGPIAQSYLQGDLHLTDDEVVRWSPMRAKRASGVGLTVVVGADETEPFRAQADAYSRRNHGVANVLDGLNHMTTLLALTDPSFPMGRLLGSAVRDAR